ncbi:MAG: pirin family protein [Deltaproteobacteria bacterium]|jgi:redox-sensitive bicupin YhaK (pirin superfamily)|nr:pirin family protein [Deltaproteobacteria bacterium]
MTSSGPIRSIQSFSFPWQTVDPFLFCVHHEDFYPPGNEVMGPAASLAGRNIGMDFDGKDGWRMYHGDTVPGFPRHPHRGFETVTIARRGYIDHSDSLGATARFGQGDAQWMTAGKGIVHSEMFPLVDREGDNPTELFQIWLNLPRSDKMVDPYFTMLWSEQIGRVSVGDGKLTSEVTVVAGALGDVVGPPPPPNSWASRKESEVAIWTIVMQPGATLGLPAASSGVNRTLYYFRGSGLRIAGREIPSQRVIEVAADSELELVGGDDIGELLVLQGRPIGEPVVQYGPFVMNTPQEIQKAMIDYQRTQFGGWPWNADDPVHARAESRFAIHAGGRREQP